MNLAESFIDIDVDMTILESVHAVPGDEFFEGQLLPFMSPT